MKKYVLIFFYLFSYKNSSCRSTGWRNRPWPRILDPDHGYFLDFCRSVSFFETVGEYTFPSRSRWAVRNLPARRGIDPLTGRPNQGPDHSAKPGPDRKEFFEGFMKKICLTLTRFQHTNTNRDWLLRLIQQAQFFRINLKYFIYFLLNDFHLMTTVHTQNFFNFIS